MAKIIKRIRLQDDICGSDDNDGIPVTGLKLSDGRTAYGEVSLIAHSSTPQFTKAAIRIAAGRGVIVRGQR